MRDLWALARQYLEKHPKSREGNISKYFFVILSVLIFFGFEIILFLTSGIGPRFILSMFIVIVCAWFGGFGPGVLATLLSGGLTYYFLFEPRGSLLAGENTANLVYLFIFFILGFFISILIESHRKADRQKSDFLGLISHELKNPLTSVKAYAQLISRFAKGKKETAIIEFAERIDKQINNMSEMVSYMLDITKIETGQLQYRDEVFVVSDLVKEVVKDQQVITDTHTIHFSSSADKTVMGDRYRIGQVLINLISNAIKYSPYANKVIVTIASRRNGIQVSVKDFGIGIKAKDREKMFQPFFRSENAKNVQGTGVGLYISSQIVERHKGKLWFHSRPGKGSTFYLWLPETKN